MATPEELVADELAALLHKVDDSSSGPLEAEEGDAAGSVTTAPPDDAAPEGGDGGAAGYRQEESKKELRLQQQIDGDEDVRTFSQDIEGVLHQVARSAGRYVWGMKQRLRQENLVANEDMRRQHSEQMLKLHKSLQGQRMDVERMEAETGRARQRVAGLLDRVVEQRRKRGQQRLLGLVLGEWRAYTAAQAGRRRAVDESSRRAGRLRVASHCFHAWSRATLQGKLDHAVSTHQRAIEGISREIVRKYEGELTRLRAEVAARQDELEREVAKRHRTKEELHRTFLKGWTSMNLEALALLGRQASFDGPASVLTGDSPNASLTGLTPPLGYDEQPRPPLVLEPAGHNGPVSPPS